MKRKRNFEKYSNNTLIAQASDLSLFVDFLEKENIKLEDVGIDGLFQFREYLIKEPISKTGKYRNAKTINRCIKTVVSFYMYLYADDKLNVNISQYINKESNKKKYTGMLNGIFIQSKATTSLLTLKESKFNEEILTYEELMLIIRCCKNKRDQLIIRVLIETGMRIGELLNLQIEDIDIFNTRLCIVNRGYKNGGYSLKSVNSERKIPVTKTLLNDLITYVMEEYPSIDSTYIFNKTKGPNKGEQLDYVSIHALFKRIKKSSKIEKLHTHLIRKTTITSWVLSNMDKVIVQTLAGHKSISTTEKYYVNVSLLRTTKELETYERKKLLNA